MYKNCIYVVAIKPKREYENTLHTISHIVEYFKIVGILQALATFVKSTVVTIAA